MRGSRLRHPEAVRKVARRRADAQFELSWLDPPVVEVDVPKRERSLVERQLNSPTLPRIEPDLRECLQLVQRPGNTRFDVADVTLHDFRTASPSCVRHADSNGCGGVIPLGA